MELLLVIVFLQYYLNDVLQVDPSTFTKNPNN